jgi:hypothetical protein
MRTTYHYHLISKSKNEDEKFVSFKNGIGYIYNKKLSIQKK